ncbi:transposase family protein [Streptomyces sp. NPDC058872]|uniref:transposase family protein n=1 Tax=Streptomyces sp. NPDC058872 TaxID=3346661 RepID=UPI0036765E5E
MSHAICTGIPRRRPGKLVAELSDPRITCEEFRLHERRCRERQRVAGAGPDHQLVFADRVIATPVVLRFQLPHAALAMLYGVDRSTITRAVHEIRPCSRPAASSPPANPTCAFAP